MYSNVLQMYYKCIQIYEHDSAHFLFAPGNQSAWEAVAKRRK